MSISNEPLEAWGPAQLESLIGLVETETLEFKGGLSAPSGETDGWYGGRKLGLVAKKSIIKEIVAFANSSGGTLFLGVAEAKDDGRNRAASLSPLPRVAKLAGALADAISGEVDPKIPSVAVVPIFVDDEESGVVAISVGRSIAAPHRSKYDKEFYSRRGDVSEPMVVREVQELVRSRDRQEDRIRQVLSTTTSSLMDRAKSLSNDETIFVSIAVTCHELAKISVDPMEAKRISDHWNVGDDHESQNLPSMIPIGYSEARRILRGFRFGEGSEDYKDFVLDIKEDGTVGACFAVPLNPVNEQTFIYTSKVAASLLHFFSLFGAFTKQLHSETANAAWSMRVSVPSDEIGATFYENRFRKRLPTARSGTTISEPIEFLMGSDPREIANSAFSDFCHVIGVEANSLLLSES